MKTPPPITNFNKFEKVHWRSHLFLQSNCEFFGYSGNTYHYHRKNNQHEGIEIKWKDNPFELDYKFDYVL